MVQPKAKNFIPRDATNIIKGVAIVLMFVHHFFTFPKWHVAGADFSGLYKLAPYLSEPLKICVAIFAFLTGYFYFFSKNKTLKYSIKKSTDVYLTFVIYYLLLLLPVFLFGINLTSKQIALGFLTLDPSVMVFGWYIAFYILSIFLLPLYDRLSKKASVAVFFITLLLPQITTFICFNILGGKHQTLNDINNCFSWFPCVAGGYLVAKHNLFQQFSDLIKTKNKLLRCLAALVAMALAATARLITRHFDFASAALFIWAILEIYSCINRKKLLLPLSLLGKYSLQMWLLHSIFFNVCKPYTQSFLFFADRPALVTVWGLLLCFAAAFILDFPIKLLTRAKNKLLRLE